MTEQEDQPKQEAQIEQEAQTDYKDQPKHEDQAESEHQAGVPEDQAGEPAQPQRHTMTEEEELDRITEYLDDAFPCPSFTPPWNGGDGNPQATDIYTAKLPDRITQASLLYLGTEKDQRAPSVAYVDGVTTRDLPGLSARLLIPERPIPGKWAVSIHGGGWWRGSNEYLEYSWRPEVAACGNLSGTTLIDVDYPLAPQHTVPQMIDSIRAAVDYARAEGATTVTAIGYSSGAALAAMCCEFVDSLVLMFPDLGSVAKLPAEISQGVSVPDPATWPRTLVQLAQQDEVAAHPENLDGLIRVLVRRYTSHHRITVPDVARRKVRDVAKFLESLT